MSDERKDSDLGTSPEDLQSNEGLFFESGNKFLDWDLEHLYLLLAWARKHGSTDFSSLADDEVKFEKYITEVKSLADIGSSIRERKAYEKMGKWDDAEVQEEKRYKLESEIETSFNNFLRLTGISFPKAIQMTEVGELLTSEVDSKLHTIKNYHANILQWVNVLDKVPTAKAEIVKSAQNNNPQILRIAEEASQYIFNRGEVLIPASPILFEEIYDEIVQLFQDGLPGWGDFEIVISDPHHLLREFDPLVLWGNRGLLRDFWSNIVQNTIRAYEQRDERDRSRRSEPLIVRIKSDLLKLSDNPDKQDYEVADEIEQAEVQEGRLFVGLIFEDQAVGFPTDRFVFQRGKSTQKGEGIGIADGIKKLAKYGVRVIARNYEWQEGKTGARLVVAIPLLVPPEEEIT